MIIHIKKCGAKTFGGLCVLFFIFFNIGFLFSQNQAEIAKRYVIENAEKSNLTSSDVQDLRLSSSYFSPTTGLTHIYLNQTYQSIDIHNALVSITMRGNQVEYTSNSLINNFSQKAPQNITAFSSKITPSMAIQAVANKKGLKIGNLLELSVQKYLNGAISKGFFKDNGLSNGNIEAELFWLNHQVIENGKNKEKISLTWNVRFLTKNNNNAWNMHVDAISGEIVQEHDDVIHCDFGSPNHLAAPHNCVADNVKEIPTLPKSSIVANSYKVFDYPLESPIHGSQTSVISPYTRFAPANTGPGGTNGWHNDGIGEYITTKGNNVWAKEDIANDNEGTIGTSPIPVMLDFDYNYTSGTGTSATNLNASITNLFYWNNLIHDVLWRYGFDEPSGNFQNSNLGRGGAGNDFVYADAQDGSGTNNANFFTPIDGTNARMQMYIWSNTGNPAYTPDSDFDNGIIAHEYGHGWSIRLTGGPSNSSCLQNAEQGGEGWSDYASLMFTTDWSALTPTVASANIPRGIGTYVLGQPITGAGIRPYRYSYDMTNINGPVTYAKVGDGNFSQPHGIGSIWATILWDMTWEIIFQDNQIVNNIYNTPANIMDMRGNIAALKLVNEGLRLQPCSPSFVDARNAILQADQILFNGRYKCAIGRAFARRGLGLNASTGSSSNDRTVIEDFTPITSPVLNSPLNNIVCSNSVFNYTATTATTGTFTYNWNRAAVVGISNPASSGTTNIINETLVNTTSRPIEVTYFFNITPNDCNTIVPLPVKVTVGPAVIPIVANYSVCLGASVPTGEGISVTATGTTSVLSSFTTNSPTSFGGKYYRAFTFVAPSTGTVTFDNLSNNFDAYLYLYITSFNPNNTSTNFLTSNDDGGEGVNARIIYNLTAGTTYVIVASTFSSGSTGNYEMRCSLPLLNGTNNWYLNATGGTVLASTNIFNPVGVAGSGIIDTNTPGVYNFYAANSEFPNCRTLFTFNILVNTAPVATGTTVDFGYPATLTSTGCTGENKILKWYKTLDDTEVNMPVSPLVNTQYYSICSTIAENVTCYSVKSNNVFVNVIAPTVIRVNNQLANPVTQNGISWQTAFNDLQTALSYSVNGTEIWVAKGTYTPTNTSNRSISFLLPSGVKLYGGFDGSETSLSQRNSKFNKSILSGEIGQANNIVDNSMHVITILNNAFNNIIDGIVVKNGYAASQEPLFNGFQNNQSLSNAVLSESGGAIYIQNSSPSIINCELLNNTAMFGGAIYAESNSNPIIERSIIAGNVSNLGGGFYFKESNSTITNSLIIGNKSFGGAAIFNNNSAATITNCTISGNNSELPFLYNSTSAGKMGSALIKNSILWSNIGGNGSQSAISYSIVEGGAMGTGNLNVNPLFTDQKNPENAPFINGNYRLGSLDSPALNAGENGTITLTALDLDGYLRRHEGGITDMGAYEYRYIAFFDSAQSGDWNLPSTWVCNCIPDLSLPVRIMGTHNVNVPTGYNARVRDIVVAETATITIQETGNIELNQQ